MAPPPGGGPPVPPPRGSGVLIAVIAATPVHLVGIPSAFAAIFGSPDAGNRLTIAVVMLAGSVVLTAPAAVLVDRRIKQRRPEWSRGQRIAAAIYIGSAIAAVIAWLIAAVLALLAAGLVFGACFCMKR